MFRYLRIHWLAAIALSISMLPTSVSGSPSCNATIQRAVIDVIELQDSHNITILELQRARTLLRASLDSCDIPSSGVELPLLGRSGKLELLIIADDVERLRALFERRNVIKKALTTKSTGGTSLLHLASAFGTPDTIHMLVEHGINVDVRDDYGNTPLMSSVGGLQTDMRNSDTLLRLGADVNAVADNGMTALTWAIAERDVAAVQFLLANGASVTPGDSRAVPALDFAKHIGDEAILSVLQNAQTQ